MKDPQHRHRAKASHETQQAQAILKAGKSDKNDSTQKRVESVNRGGLPCKTNLEYKISRIFLRIWQKRFLEFLRIYQFPFLENSRKF